MRRFFLRAELTLPPVFLCLMLILLSCSGSVPENDGAGDGQTLRHIAAGLEESVSWTAEIEPGRLTRSVSAVDGVSSRLNLSPVIMLASVPPDDSRVFPELENFGSLDTSLIPVALRSMLASFARSVCSNKDADSFMEEGCLYSLSLFYEDISRIFAGRQGSGAEGGAELFSSFRIGQPFLDGIHYEVPLKFFSDAASLTLRVFCSERDGSWRIGQIQIADWELADARR